MNVLFQSAFFRISSLHIPLQGELADATALGFGPFATQENLDQALAYVEQSLSNSGFATAPISLRANDDASLVSLTNALHSLLQSHQRASDFRSHADGDVQRMRSDLRTSQQQITRLHAALEDREREVRAASNQARQAIGQLRAELLQAQTERDDARREGTALQYRSTQFAHELKRREVEYEKLQDRYRTLLNERTRERQAAESRLASLASSLSAPAPVPGRTAGRAAAATATAPAAAQDDLYRMIVSAYDQKIQELVMENKELKDRESKLGREVARLQHPPTAAEERFRPATASQPLNPSGRTNAVPTFSLTPVPASALKGGAPFVSVPHTASKPGTCGPPLRVPVAGPAGATPFAGGYSAADVSLELEGVAINLDASMLGESDDQHTDQEN